LPFTEKFQDAKVLIPEPDDDAPQVERAIITFENTEWNATKLITPNKIIVALVNTQATSRHMEDFLEVRIRTIKQIFPFSLAMSIVAAFFVTRKTLTPIKRIQASLRAVDTRDLTTRVPHLGEDREFREFIDVFNNMLARLERGFLQASRFSSDAAHELRTPLTVIRGNLKRLLNRAPDNSVEQMQLSMLSDEVERLISITNKLVLLSQADGRNFKLEMQEINLMDVIGILSEDIQSLVPDIQFKLLVSPQIKILADPNLFQQLLNNLMSNAVKYTSPDGTIVFEAKVIDNLVEFSLANTTYLSMDGLDDRVFQRFYRHLNEADSSRQLPRGDGLGLSLCQEIAKAHGGSLTLEKGPDNWVKFKSHWKTA
jgi:signal transduction histidine kinase